MDKFIITFSRILKETNIHLYKHLMEKIISSYNTSSISMTKYSYMKNYIYYIKNDKIKKLIFKRYQLFLSKPNKEIINLFEKFISDNNISYLLNNLDIEKYCKSYKTRYLITYLMLSHNLSVKVDYEKLKKLHIEWLKILLNYFFKLK